MTALYIKKPRASKVCGGCLTKITKKNQSKLDRFTCIACEKKPSFIDQLTHSIKNLIIKYQQE